MSRRILMLSVLVALASAPTGGGTAQVQPATIVAVPLRPLADSLGLRIWTSDPPPRLDVGRSVDFELIDPLRLANHTGRRLKYGAHVTITRITAEHLRIVADEADPMPKSDRVTLRINGNGTYSALYRNVTQVGRAPLRE